MNINGQNVFLKGVRNEHIPQELEDYPFTLPVVRNLTSLEFDRSVTYIVGENGSGKSTFLEAIATHSPIILSFPDAEILVIDDGRLIPTDYEDCYIYRDMLSFIMNRNMIINELFR